VCAQSGAAGRPSSAAARSSAGTCSYTVSAPAARVLEMLAVAWDAAADASRDISERSVHLKYIVGIHVFSCILCCDMTCALAGSGFDGAARGCAGGCVAVSRGGSARYVMLRGLLHALRLVSLPAGKPKGIEVEELS
jgi:hypothetical protein